jgi:hypothetical protein
MNRQDAKIGSNSLSWRFGSFHLSYGRKKPAPLPLFRPPRKHGPLLVF